MDAGRDVVEEHDGAVEHVHGDEGDGVDGGRDPGVMGDPDCRQYGLMPHRRPGESSNDVNGADG